MTSPSKAHDHERQVAASIVARLRAGGHEAYFVGGCVREMLLGGDPADYDVTTDATPDRVIELFPKVVEVGKQFGVVMVVEDDVVVEVATYRTEGSYTDGRRPDSVSFSNAMEDVSRRDFTVNALLMDPVTGHVVDHVGGLEDLQRRVLRTVGDPRERFLEDRLRILRAVRFTARLGFDLDPATREACAELAPRVVSVSAERIREELTRMLAHATRATALRLLAELGVLAHVLPEVDALRGITRTSCCAAERSVYDHAFAALARLRPDASPEAAWATLLHDIGWPEAQRRAAEAGEGLVRHEVVGAELATAIARRLKMSNRETERIASLVRDHLLPREAECWRLSRLRQVLALPWLDDLLDVARAEGVAHDGCTSGIDFLEQQRMRWGTRLPPVLVTGDDAQAAGVPRGKSLGRVLDQVRAEQLDGLLATREDALARLAELAAEG